MAKKKAPAPVSSAERELFLNAIDGLGALDFAQHRDVPEKPKVAKPRPTGPEAVIDLHALTLEIALLRTEEFLKRCKLKKYRQVLIIHGKGSGVLKEGVRRYLQQHPLVIKMDEAERQHGGSGATMVMIQK